MKRARLVIAWTILALLVGLGPPSVEAQRVPPGGAPPGGTAPIDLPGYVRVIDASTIDTWINGQRVGIRLIGVADESEDQHDEEDDGQSDDKKDIKNVVRQVASTVAQKIDEACRKQGIDTLQALAKGGLRLTDDPELVSTYFPFDAQGRRLFHVSTPDGRSVAEELVKAGVARTDGRGKDGAKLRDAEKRAKGERKGCVWQQLVSADEAEPGDEASVMMKVGDDPTTEARSAAAAPLASTLPSGFTEDVVAGSLDSPTAFAFLPDGRIVIAEKKGTVRVFKNGALLPTPMIDLQDRVNDY